MATATEANLLNPGWGISPPADPRIIAAWGARAIYTRCRYNVPRGPHRKGRTVGSHDIVIDLLYDRQGAAGDDECVHALTRWLNGAGRSAATGALAQLRALCAAEGLASSERRLLVIDEPPFTLHADPKASYGYLYIGAWMVTP